MSKTNITTSGVKGKCGGRMASSRAVLVATLLAISAAVAACSDGTNAGAADDDITYGVTEQVDLAPFDEGGPVGSKPDLPGRVAVAMDNDREYAQQVLRGFSQAAEDRGLEVVSANANGDQATNIQQIEQFMAQGVGSILINPIDTAAQRPVMEEAIKQGIAVMAVATPPGTLQLNAAQYDSGEALGTAAADYIESDLGGEANVVIFNHDSIEAVRPRWQAVRDVLGELPEVTIVSDQEPAEVSKEGGFEAMSTILQKNPDIDVILGADSVSLGALAALEAAGKDSPDQFIGGVDGEEEALGKILEGDGPYKASVGFNTPVWSYTAGWFAADWLEGKTIPQAVGVVPILLDSPELIESFKADQENPTDVFADPERRSQYVSFWGGLNYDSRGDYLDYIWSPDTTS